MPTLTEFLMARIAEDEDDYGCDGQSEYSRCAMLSERQDLEAAAKRLLVEDHLGTHRCEWGDIVLAGRCEARVLRILGAIYADHRDYDEEWR